MEAYSYYGLKTQGFYVKESDLKFAVLDLLKKDNFDVLVLTGHDSFQANEEVENNNLTSYRNSYNYLLAVIEARKRYPDKDNLDIRKQSTNFANIPILSNDVKNIFDECEIGSGNIDAFVLAPLNSNDFPTETLKFLNSFDVPIFISLQGFLRFRGVDGSLILKLSDNLKTLFEISNTIFMDEREFDIIKSEKFEGPTLVVTNGSKGSRIIDVNGETIKINAVKCDNIKDATGSGDTYMAAYISAILNNKSYQKSGNFASFIASEKLKNFGPYKKL